MFTVVVIHGGIKTEYEYKTEKQAMKHYAGWYNHSMDIYGQIKSSIEIWDKNNKCIMADCI